MVSRDLPSWRVTIFSCRRSRPFMEVRHLPVNCWDVLGPAVVERYNQILKFEGSLVPLRCYRVGIQYREGYNTSMKGRERLQEIGKSRETIQFHYDALVLSMEVRHLPVNCWDFKAPKATKTPTSIQFYHNFFLKICAFDQQATFKISSTGIKDSLAADDVAALALWALNKAVSIPAS